MGEHPDDLDAVALGLKRGRQGVVTMGLLLSLVLGGVLLTPREEGAHLASPQAAPAVIPAEASKKPPAFKPSRSTRAAPRAVPRSIPVEVVVKGEANDAARAEALLKGDENDAARVDAPLTGDANTAERVEAPLKGDANNAAGLGATPRLDANDDARAEVDATASPPPTPAREVDDAHDGNGEAIARAIAAAKRAAVRECFERELKQTPKLSGTVMVELDPAPPNRVTDVRVSDDLERPTFTRCVTATMRDVRFAALDEDVSVRVPYALKPERK